jgi:hypothetical protein
VRRLARGDLPDSTQLFYGGVSHPERVMADTSPSYWRLHCPECGCGNREFGHLARPDDVFCIVCLEYDGIYVRLDRWEEKEPAQVNRRGGLALAWATLLFTGALAAF